MGYIYKIISPSGRIYIGQTKNLKNRISYYKTVKCKTQIKLYNSLLKYGWDKHSFEVIDSCSVDLDKKELDEKEKYWIKFYNSHHDGLNCNDGGQGHLGRKQSSEHIAKRVEFLKLKGRGVGRKRSKESNDKIILTRNINPYKHSDEIRIKISEASKGRKFSEEAKKNMGLSRLGKKRGSYKKTNSCKLDAKI